MTDEFKAEFVIELDRDAVIDALTATAELLEPDEDGSPRLLLPGFPSMEPTPAPGAICTQVTLEPGRLLKVRKEHEPCAGTEIAISLADEGTGTRITVVQSGFGPWFDFAKDTITAHGNEIVADLLLFLERGHRVPEKNWGAPLGGFTRESPTGLVVTAVDQDGFMARAGMAEDDLLVSLAGVRIYNTNQLWTALPFFSVGDTAEATWLRGRTLHTASASF